MPRWELSTTANPDREMHGVASDIAPASNTTGAFLPARASSLAINWRETIAAARLRPPYLALPCAKMPHLTQALCYCSSSAQSQRLRREADTRNVRPREGLLLASVPGPGHPPGLFVSQRVKPCRLVLATKTVGIISRQPSAAVAPASASGMWRAIG